MKEVLKDTSLIFVEVYNFELTEKSLRFHEICTFLEEKGFRPLDLFDISYRPADRVLWQFDLVFARSDLSSFSVATYETT